MQIDSQRDIEKLLSLCGTEVNADSKAADTSDCKWKTKDDYVLISFDDHLQKFSLRGSDPVELFRLFESGRSLVGDFVKVAYAMNFLQAVESFEGRSFSFRSENVSRVTRLIGALDLPCVVVIKEKNSDLCGRFRNVILIGDAHKIPEIKNTGLLLFAEDEEEAYRLSKKFCGCYLAMVI